MTVKIQGPEFIDVMKGHSSADLSTFTEALIRQKSLFTYMIN